MSKTDMWLLVANSNSAFVYDVTKRTELDALRDHLIKSFDFPAGRLKNSELGNDEPGRYQAMSNPRSGYEPDTDPHHVELDRFSRLITDFLLTEKLAHRFEHLIICAEPHFLGILEAQFPKALTESITKTINKDYIPMINGSFNDFISKIKDNLL